MPNPNEKSIFAHHGPRHDWIRAEIQPNGDMIRLCTGCGVSDVVGRDKKGKYGGDFDFLRAHHGCRPGGPGPRARQESPSPVPTKKGKRQK